MESNVAVERKNTEIEDRLSRFENLVTNNQSIVSRIADIKERVNGPCPEEASKSAESPSRPGILSQLDDLLDRLENQQTRIGDDLNQIEGLL